jgi:NAD-dependent dihydropyrimidine dehydrogenase PreA subunit
MAPPQKHGRTLALPRSHTLLPGRWRRPLSGTATPAAVVAPRRPQAWWARLRQWIGALPGNVFFYVFRAAPYPVAPQLIAIGNPHRRSPVLVTSNYALTVRRVTRALRGTDCYLLVAPAGGINVWCAAGDGHFSVDSIISILKTSRIADLVDHRRLVLPELCANGINMFEVKRRTGWTAVFGPARIEDCPEYLRTRKKTERMVRVTFTHAERFEMAVAMWGSVTLRYTLFPALLFGWSAAAWFAGILAVLSVTVSHGCFVLPGKTFVQKALLVGVSLLAAVLVALAWAGPLTAAVAGVVATLMLPAAFLIGSAFPGYSPYWQCGYSKLFFGYPDLQLTVVEDDCIGCKICWDVCPVDCFAPTDRHTYQLINPGLCEGCMACVIQCPTGTIINEVAAHHRRETACG